MRRSQAFSQGQPYFSWKLEKFTDADGRERHKAVCKSHPDIIGIGDDETTAMRAGKAAMEIAVDKAEV